MKGDDAQLHEQVSAALAAVPALRGLEILISVHEGVVTLSGCVRREDQKITAGQAAVQVGGTIVVANHLRQHGSSSPKPDSELAHSVARHLRRAATAARNLTARIEEGWVTLEGEAELFSMCTALEKQIRVLQGVRGVTNLVTVVPPELVNGIAEKVDTHAGGGELRTARSFGPPRESHHERQPDNLGKE